MDGSLTEAFKRANQELVETMTNPESGFTSGFNRIDKLSRRMKPGQLWVVGGYSGVGKSYFALNMLENILGKHPEARISVYSTELLVEDYIQRHILMRAGLWESDLEGGKEGIVKALANSSEGYNRDVVKAGNVKIFGGISDYKEIAQTWDNPDIAIIDFVQELSINNKHEAKDTMPLLAASLKNLALSSKSIVIAVSQISNAGQREKFKEQTVAPFDYGKELNRAAHTAIVLKRDKLPDGKLSMVMQANIFKARKGTPGLVYLLVDRGFKIKEADRAEILNQIEKEKIISDTFMP